MRARARRITLYNNNIIIIILYPLPLPSEPLLLHGDANCADMRSGLVHRGEPRVRGLHGSLSFCRASRVLFSWASEGGGIADTRRRYI